MLVEVTLVSKSNKNDGGFCKPAVGYFTTVSIDLNDYAEVQNFKFFEGHECKFPRGAPDDKFVLYERKLFEKL